MKKESKKEHLPPWHEDQGDHIMGLSLTVNVKGDSDEQILFYQYLKKWLVAMVASWVSPKVVNNVMLVLIGEQAYALYRQGFRYWFDKPEIERLQRHNEQFETVHSELETH